MVDATVFRFVAREAAGKIRGARLEKVFAPFPACWTFDLGQPGFLVVHAGKPDPFLLLSSAKPENPLQPDARAKQGVCRVIVFAPNGVNTFVKVVVK